MKTFLACLALCLAPACIALKPDVLPTDGAIGRQIHRVADRHDGYVLADPTIDSVAQHAALAASAGLLALADLPEVPRPALRAALAPVAARHDAYVVADGTLDAEARAIFLAATEQLQRLAGAK